MRLTTQTSTNTPPSVCIHMYTQCTCTMYVEQTSLTDLYHSKDLVRREISDVLVNLLNHFYNKTHTHTLVDKLLHDCTKYTVPVGTCKALLNCFTFLSIYCTCTCTCNHVHCIYVYMYILYITCTCTCTCMMYTVCCTCKVRKWCPRCICETLLPRSLLLCNTKNNSIW